MTSSRQIFVSPLPAPNRILFPFLNGVRFVEGMAADVHREVARVQPQRFTPISGHFPAKISRQALTVASVDLVRGYPRSGPLKFQQVRSVSAEPRQPAGTFR
jgi:hypothetical protein